MNGGGKEEDGLDLQLEDHVISLLLQHADQDKDGFLNFREFSAQFGVGVETDGSRASDVRNAAVSSARGKDVMGGLAKMVESTPAMVAPNHSESKAGGIREMSYAELSAIGSLRLLSGGAAVIQDDNLISTAPGHRATVSPRGVIIREGCYYFEILVVTGERARFVVVLFPSGTLVTNAQTVLDGLTIASAAPMAFARAWVTTRIRGVLLARQVS